MAKWARDAGFSGDELHRAVAVAMASSQGDDHHVSNPAYLPSLERRGLWALRAAECPDVHPDALWNPATAAKAAYGAWAGAGRTWRWHPVYLSGASDEHVPLVRAVLTGKLREVTDPNALTFAGVLDRAVRLAQAMRQQTQTRGL